MAATRRNGGERGQELIEFAITAILLVGLLVGAFVAGMNLIRSIQVNQVCRDLDNMYIHGADFSTYPMQQLAQRLAQGLGLQIGASFSGNSATNTGTAETFCSRCRGLCTSARRPILIAPPWALPSAPMPIASCSPNRFSSGTEAWPTRNPFVCSPPAARFHRPE